MKLKTLCLCVLISLPYAIASAKDEVVVMSSSNYKKANFDELKNKSGIMIEADKFLDESFKKTSQGKQLPNAIIEMFGNDSKLVLHSAVLKIDKDYDTFISKALKSKTSIQNNLLYNSKVASSEDVFSPCATLNGGISTIINLPAIVKAFAPSDKLECDISITDKGIGKKLLRPELLSQLPKNLEDDDVRSLSLTFSKCNMIFKGLAQNIYFIKASDGKTIILSDNYSLVKQATLDTIPFGALGIVNGQVKNNMAGLLAYVSAPK